MEIIDDTIYQLAIEKSNIPTTRVPPTQVLYCHEKCLEEKLINPEWLFLKEL